MKPYYSKGNVSYRLVFILLAALSSVVTLASCGGPSTQSNGSRGTSLARPGETVRAVEKSSAQEAGVTSLPAQMPSDFWLGAVFAKKSADETLTESVLELSPRPDGSAYEGSYVTYSAAAAAKTAAPTFSRDEVLLLYEQLRDLQFLTYPVEASPLPSGDKEDQPFSTRTLAVGFNGVDHSVFWSDLATTAETEALDAVMEDIREMLQKKLE
jgi:hypothetical protein